jgi:hypothetical protein
MYLMRLPKVGPRCGPKQQLLNEISINKSIGLFVYCSVDGQNTANHDAQQDTNSKGNSNDSDCFLAEPSGVTVLLLPVADVHFKLIVVPDILIDFSVTFKAYYSRWPPANVHCQYSFISVFRLKRHFL